MSATDETLEKTLRVFLRLLDLSRDLERNDDDSLFRNEGGTLHYVFDADLFEIFINPRDVRGRTASMHSSRWTIANQDRTNTRGWDAVASQTALSTSEYVLSGTLPGQRDESLLMSHEHRWELARRVETLAAHYFESLNRSAGDRTSLERMKRVQTIRQQARAADWPHIDQFDAFLCQDLRALSTEGFQRTQLSQIAGTRAALKILAEDTAIEPAEQIERIVGPALRRRFGTLHQQFPIAPEEEEAVAADAKEWFARLLDEARLQRIEVLDSKRSDLPARDSQQRGRSRAALWDDARSLATARWVASRKMSSKARLVLVTADELLFDTYRRWYANLRPSDVAYSEPFLLRRFSQFAPLFNLTDIGKLRGDDARDVFKDLRHLVEVNLLTLNLSRLNNRRVADPIMTRMRELSALRQVDHAPIAKDPLYAHLASALRRRIEEDDLTDMEDVLKNLRLLERISLGQVDDHVRARLSEREAELIGLTSGSGGDRVVRYVGDLIHKMLAASLQLWLPLAREFIDAWRPRKGMSLIRAPVAIRLRVSSAGTELDIGGALERSLANPDSPDPLLPTEVWNRLGDDEPLVFSIAAVLALASADWSTAEQFADMANRSQARRKPNLERLAEVRYLAAISKRFRIGMLSAPANPDALNKFVRTYRAAQDLITFCVDHHANAPEANPQHLRMLRAYSERAALGLFFVSALTPAVAGANRAMRHASTGAPVRLMSAADYLSILGDTPLSVAKRRLVDVENDLRRCLALDDAFGSTIASDKQDALRVIRRQYLANICSASVAWRLLGEPTRLGELSPANSRLVMQVRDFLHQHAARAHGVMRLEMLSFLALSGDPQAAAQVANSKDLPPDALALDRALHRAIKEFDFASP